MDETAGESPTPGPEAASEAIRLVHEARSLWEQGKLPESEPLLRRALGLAEGTLGLDHPEVASVLSHLGWLARTRGQEVEAVAAYRRALAIRDSSLGPDHPDTLYSAEELAATLFDASEYDEADAMTARALAGREAAGGDDEVGLAGLVSTLAWRRYYVGRYAEAEPLYLRALEMQGRILGPGDPATANTARRLAMLYDYGHIEGRDPEPFYRRALGGLEQAVDPEHLALFEARYRLADHLHRRGRDAEAGPLFDRLVADLGPDGPGIDLEAVHWMLGSCCRYLRDSGRAAEAEAIEVRASSYDPNLISKRAEVERIARAFGPDSIELAEALGRLSGGWALAGRGEEAEDAARRALGIFESRLGPQDPRSVKAAARLAKAPAIAASFAATRGVPRLDRSEDLQFDEFDRPWADDRRDGLFRAYFEALARPDEDDPTGAVMTITGLTFAADADEQWGVILDLIARAPDEEDVLQTLAAGPLEGFLGRFDGEVIDRVEAEAARDPKFRRVLSGVWKHGMSDPVWGRIRAIQATVPDPLPEMRPPGTNQGRP